MEATENGNGKSNAIIKVTERASTAYDPRTSSEAFEIAKHFAASKLLADLNADAVFLIMAVGAELGIPATAALRSVYVVKGKPFVSADLMKSLCLRRKDICEFFRLVKSTAESATYTAKRVGDDPVTLSWTMEQAKKTGNVKPDSAWSTYPEVMLRHRCVAMLAREVFPDLCLGIYCEEERGEIEERQHVVDAQVIEEAGTDDLEERIAAFAQRIESAATPAGLKLIVPDVNADPAAATIMERLGEAYQTKKTALKETT